MRGKTGIFAVLISDSVVFTTEFPEDVENRTAVRVFSPQRFSIPLEKNVNQSRCRRKYRFARHRPTRVSHYVLCECLAYRNSVVFTTEFAEDFEDCTAVRVFSPQRFPIPLEKQRKSKPKNGKTPLFRCFPASFPHKD